MSNKFLTDNCIFEENPKNAFLLTSFLIFFSKPMLFLKLGMEMKNCSGDFFGGQVHIRFPSYEPKTTPLP